MVILFALPLLILIGKWSALPTSTFLNEHVSLLGLGPDLQFKLRQILFVPSGALLVVLVRLTLGLRVLGPFRSILLAVAFQITGAILGLFFLTATILAVLAVQSPVKGMKLPFFGRTTTMLSFVAALMVLGVLVGIWLDIDVMQKIVFLPVVVLSLVADAFGRTLRNEGLASALWRGTMTALIAVVLAAVESIPAVSTLLLKYPELLLVQIGAIIVVSKFLAFRYLDWLNPQVKIDPETEFERS
jgi:hypothetical protein